MMAEYENPIFEESPAQLFEIGPSERDEERINKRLHRRFYDFLRLHYICIFKILLLMNLFLLAVIIFQYLHQAQTEGSHHDSNFIENGYEGKNETKFENIMKENSTEQATNAVVLPQGMKCPKRCKLNNCEVSAISFEILKYYTCCKCFDPTKFLIRRIEHYPLGNFYFIIFQYLAGDVRNYTEYDLKLIGPLPNLAGEWNVVSDSDTTFWLKYGPVQLPPTPMPDYEV